MVTMTRMIDKNRNKIQNLVAIAIAIIKVLSLMIQLVVAKYVDSGCLFVPHSSALVLLAEWLGLLQHSLSKLQVWRFQVIGTILEVLMLVFVFNFLPFAASQGDCCSGPLPESSGPCPFERCVDHTRELATFNIKKV